jgi:hypothetical protein
MMTDGQKSNILDSTVFMNYLEKTFSGYESPFLREFTENVINHGIRTQSASKDQLVYFLSDVIPDVEFGEVAQFVSDDFLAAHGKNEKKVWLDKHPGFTH